MLVYILLLDIYFKLIFIIQYLLVLEWDLMRYFFGRVMMYRVSGFVLVENTGFWRFLDHFKKIDT